MSIKEKAKELVAGAMLMTAVATTGCCEERAYDGIDGPDYCVWSDWNNPHCGECKEEVCENYNGKAVCYEVPCGSRNEGNSESEQEALEERRRARESYERGLEDELEVVNRQLREVKPVKKSENVAATPKDICLDNYLGAKYKKGKCEFPVYERMNGRAGLEKKFESCQINKIIAGKGNTATAHAVCRGVPSIIKVKRYYQKGR